MFSIHIYAHTVEYVDMLVPVSIIITIIITSVSMKTHSTIKLRLAQHTLFPLRL